MYFVYLLKCKDGSIYTGISTDIERRFKEHCRGTASKYTKAKGALKIIYTEKCGSRSKALKRECEIKKYKRSEKIKLSRKNLL